MLDEMEEYDDEYDDEEEGEDDYDEEVGESEMEESGSGADNVPQLVKAQDSASESSIDDDMSAKGSYGSEFPVPDEFKSAKNKTKKEASESESSIEDDIDSNGSLEENEDSDSS